MNDSARYSCPERLCYLSVVPTNGGKENDLEGRCLSWSAAARPVRHALRSVLLGLLVRLQNGEQNGTPRGGAAATVLNLRTAIRG